MDVIVKPGAPKHEDHPNRDPKREILEAKGKRRLQKMKFDSEGERRDYERAVRSNKFNVPGLPPFYPPERGPAISGIGHGKPAEKLPCGHKWFRARIAELGIVLYECRYGGVYPREVVTNPEIPAREPCRKPEPMKEGA